MERTPEFAEAILKARSDSQQEAVPDRICLSSSPFVLRASELLSQIISFEVLLGNIADSFVDYHRFHPLKGGLTSSASSMSEAERVEFAQEIAIFVTTFASEVRELRQTIRSSQNAPIKKNSKDKTVREDDLSSSSKEEVIHKNDIASYLLERLGIFAKSSQRMQSQRLKYSINPLFLFANNTNSALKPEFKTTKIKSDMKNNQEIEDSDKKDFSDLLDKLDEDEKEKSKNIEMELLMARTKSTALPPVQQSFVDRYESEIAPPKQLKEYQDLGLKHKKLLLKESKSLQVQYSTDLLEASKMEVTVQKISNLLLDFVTILQGQREQVDDVNQCGKITLDFVKDTDDELSLTIQRSESHQRSMVLLTVGLGLLLLLLDYITP